MAHTYFAKIDSDNTVLQVTVVPDEEEHRGQEYLADDLGLGGTWIQTVEDEYGNRASPEYTYNPDDGCFYPPPLFPSSCWFCGTSIGTDRAALLRRRLSGRLEN